MPQESRGASHRFFVETIPPAGQVVRLDALAHQLQTVLRMAPGDRLILLDGAGKECLAELEFLARREASARILAMRPACGEPHLHLTLFQAMLKQDRFEWVLQKGTELGVARFVPVIAERSIVRTASLPERKSTRWRAILREAAEQCGRPRIPELAPPLSFAHAIAARAGVGLLAWEEADGPSLVDVLADLVEVPTPRAGRLSLLIGPEGGFSYDEVDAASAVAWRTVTLGPRILRAETAALAACAVVFAMTGEMRRSSVSTLTEDSD